MGPEVRHPRGPGRTHGSTIFGAGVGSGAFLLVAVFCVRMAWIRRTGPTTTFWAELATGTLGLILAALVLATAVALLLSRAGPGLRHVTAVLAGILLGGLILGLVGDGPFWITTDGEGNVEAAPASFVAALGSLGLVLVPPIWPRDGTGAPITAVTALLLATSWWTFETYTMDTSERGAWLALAAAVVVAGVALFALVPRTPLMQRLVRWTYVALAALLALGLLASVYVGSKAAYTSESVPAAILMAAAVLVVPLAPTVADLRALNRRSGSMVGGPGHAAGA